ncbi:MAG: tRNA (adenosine(37)-N6)-threonylcarbamoyltransferase complex dimerization subunit type 1 TsaB [Rikenellaceae bacterium]
MSLILSIESSTSICSVAIARDGEVIALRESAQGRDHARLVATYADELLKECSIEQSQLDAVAVSKGPGSYTGLRIGVSFAKGLCYGLQIPLIGVSTLESMATAAVVGLKSEERGVEPTAILAPMIDARRMEVYTQLYDANCLPISEVSAEVIDDRSFEEYRTNDNFYIFGDGSAKCCESMPWAKYIEVSPSATAIARIAQREFEAGRFEDVAYFEPFYLKEAVITKSTKKYF